MKEKQYKLWFLVLIILICLGVVTLKFHPLKVKSDKYSTSEESSNGDEMEETGSTFFLGVVDDFKNFWTVSSDLVGYINGNDSQFDSPAAVLTGNKDIATDNADEVIEEIKTQVDEKKETISELYKKKEERPLEQVTLKYVVDGDTLIVDINGIEEKVRLIGIDTPESVHSDDTKNTEWGIYASDNTKAILSGFDTLYLEYDTQIRDQYDRILAYVWLSDDTSNINNMLNAVILSDGYAMDKIYAPNEKYAETFRKLREEAANNGIGLWTNSGFCELWN